MHDVTIERGQILVPVQKIQQIGAHRHQVAGAAGRAVEPPNQLLPSRLGGEMQLAGVGIARPRPPVLDRLRKLLAIGTEMASETLEKRAPAGGVEVLVMIEN